MKRFPLFQAKTARVSRIFGALGLPVSLIAVLGHRLDAIGVWDMVLAIMLAAGLGLFAIALAMIAFAQLWRFGGRGFTHAGFGLVYGFVALLPASALIAAPLVLEGASDISTNPNDPPVIRTSGALQTGPAWTFGRPLVFTGQDDGEHPFDIVPRRYRMSPSRVHSAAREVLSRDGWTLIDETLPDLPDMPTRLQARVRSPLLGLVKDFVVRIRPDPMGALLDLRSSSQTGLRDLDSNADRIREVLAGIDDVLLETYGEVEAQDVALDERLDEQGRLLLDGTPGFAEGGRAPLPSFKPYLPDLEGDQTAPAEDLLMPAGPET
ncbi:DUF1499 domain-containing protein [Roseibium sp.]|uniref:DUF1499 domain-containing protein n=1 Tax=Roseibium sp. TaxID=1936156 RepID=UPI003A969CEE